jgi:hypothetical protein
MPTRSGSIRSAALLCAWLATGCSFLAGAPRDCAHRNYAVPVIDTVVVVGLGVGASAILLTSNCADSSACALQGVGDAGAVVLAGVIALPYLASAIYGYVRQGRCHP